MRIGVLGTGMVGQAIGSALARLGHEVRMGSRAAGGERARAWMAEAGAGASEGTFADSAAHGEINVNCTSGAASLDALAAAGEERLAGKLLIDVANPLAFSDSGVSLSVCNTDSLGERIQRAFPAARVVKTLNTLNASVMVHPGSVPGDHVLFVSGEDAAAKAQATALLGELGWPAERVIDLGGIATARGTEMYLPLWLSLYGKFGTMNFLVHNMCRLPRSG